MLLLNNYPLGKTYEKILDKILELNQENAKIFYKPLNCEITNANDLKRVSIPNMDITWYVYTENKWFVKCWDEESFQNYNSLQVSQRTYIFFKEAYKHLY